MSSQRNSRGGGAGSRQQDHRRRAGEEDAEGRGSREPDWGWAYCVSWLPWGLCTGRCWPVCSRKAQASVCWD